MGRYLLAVSPLHGHVAPMLHIGIDLRRRGHHVTVLAGADYTDTVDAADLHAAILPAQANAAPPPSPAKLSRLHLPALTRRYLLGRAELRSVFIAPLPAQYQALQALLDRQRFDAILADIAFTGVLPLLLGNRARPPILVCGVGPLTLSSIDTPPFGAAFAPQPGAEYRAMTRVVHRVLLGRIHSEFNQALRSVDASRAPVSIADWPRLADQLLQLTVPGFEYPRRDLPTTVRFAGPVLAEPAADFDPPPWWDKLHQAPLVIHVTQGTLDNTDLDQLIGPTLRALAHRDDMLVVATTGHPNSSVNGAIPANTQVTDWLPYPMLLPHVDVMITNGGYGGVHHALRFGVPVIVAGETSDKAEVGARIAYSGAGINLRTANPRPSAIAAAVDRVLHNPDYRAAARGLADAIANSTPLDTIADAVAYHANAAAAGDHQPSARCERGVYRLTPLGGKT